MSCYVLCVTSDGIPLFCRTRGELPELPFSVMGSLNAVHVFARNHDARLLNTSTESSRVYWRDMNDAIKLIAVHFDVGVADYHLNLLLENVFNAMIMTVGLHSLQEIANVDRLKKQLKACYPLVDTFLCRCHMFGDIVQVPDIVLCAEASFLQNYLDSFTSACDSDFGCLLLHQKIVVATEKWWQLAPVEAMLLLFLLQSLEDVSARDVPVYLPHGSPNVPHRLVTVSLVEHVQVVLICGPEPTMQELLRRYLRKYWAPALETLRMCKRSHPRCFPLDVKVDSNLLGLLIVNNEDGKCLSSVYPQGTMTGADSEGLTDIEKRRQALLDFYFATRSVIASSTSPASRKGERNVTSAQEGRDEAFGSYQCRNGYKCYALRSASHEVYAVYSKDIPTYCLSGVTAQILKRLTRDKSL